jgi:hypothetical protein
MRLRWLLGWAAILCFLSAACTQDLQGLRTPRSPASQSLAIRWHEGSTTSYRWQLTDDTQLDGKSSQSTIAGDSEVAVESVGADGAGLLQITLRLDPQYVTPGQSRVFVRNLDVGPRGRITGNPDGSFVELTDFFTMIPFLPPAGANPGDSWHETYKLPNPIYEDTRDFAVSGRYVRDEGAGFSRAVVIDAHMSASYNDSAPYERLYGPPPSGAPAQVEDHLNGTETIDVTYRFDPARQSLSKSTATARFNQSETFTDASNGSVVGVKHTLVGTQTLTFTRS